MFVLRFLTGVLIARALGPEGKGVLHLIVTTVTIVMWLGNFGIGPASIYFIGQDRERLPALVGNLLVLTASVGGLVMVIAWLLFQYSQADVVTQLPPWMWFVIALLIPLRILQSLLMQILSAVLRIKEINFVEILSTLVRLVSTVLFIVVWDGGIRGAFLAYALGDLVLVGGFCWMVWRHCGRPGRPDLALFGASLRFGLNSYLANLMRHLNLRLDTVLVASLAVKGMHATGVYSVATNLAELLVFIPESIRLSLFPMVAASLESDANRLTQAACRHTMFLTSICALGLAAVGPFLIRYLYGGAFGDAILPLIILLPGIVMLSQAHVFYGYFMGQGRPGVTTITTLLSLLATIGLDLVLIPRYGVVGAAIASTCAYAVEFLASLVFFIRHSGTLWQDALVFRRSDLTYYVKFLSDAVRSKAV